MSKRKVIRKELAALVNTIADINGKVFPSRAIPVDADGNETLPCVLIFTDRDPVQDLDSFSQKRTLTLRIVAIVRAAEAADDELDDICEAVERVIESTFNGDPDTDPSLRHLAESCDYVDTALTYVGEEGRAQMVQAVMSYSLEYIRTPYQEFPALVTVQAQFDMSSPRNDPQNIVAPDGQIDARTTIKFVHPE